MDTYADDLAALTEKLDLSDAIHVGHSTGGGEVARYIGRHGSKRVAMAVLISSVPPLMVKTDKNPEGAPIEVFDDLRAQYSKNRPQFYKDLTLPFYGYNRPGAKISEGIREKWWLQGMMGGVKAGYDCIKAFSETDFTEDLKKFDMPTLILHGDDDQIVPIARGGAAVGEDCEGCDVESVSRFSARHAYHPGGPDQCRPAGIHRAEACKSSSVMKTLPVHLPRSLCTGSLD